MPRLVAVALALLFAATACASAETAQPPASLPVEAPPEERTLLADVNIAIADVPLEDIVFDTFDGGSITMAEATEDEIRSLLNVIRPLDDPNYIGGADAAYLTDADLVLGYLAEDGTAWAHPHRVLNFHEIVNTDLGGRPVAITYCPLCGSGVVFDRRPNDLRHEGVLTFDNTSALYESDMVMVDAETHTYWWQIAGRGLVGNLTGAELVSLPSMTTTWSSWLELHPETMVLSNDQGRGPSYERDPFVDIGTSIDNGRLRFPVRPEAFDDDRLAASTRVIGFDSPLGWTAVAVLSNEPAVVSIPEPATLVLLDGLGGGGVFAHEVDLAVRNGAFVSPDGATWDLAGRSDDGRQLTEVPSRTAYWFSWITVTDGQTRLFGPAGEID